MTARYESSEALSGCSKLNLEVYIATHCNNQWGKEKSFYLISIFIVASVFSRLKSY